MNLDVVGRIGAGSAIVAVLASSIAAATPAAAKQTPLPAGACVTAYGNTGRIVGTVQNGYRIATDADPSGTPMVAPASDTKLNACKATAAPAARGTVSTPNPALVAGGGGAGCFASSAPSTLTSRGQAFAAVMLRHWTVPADPGSDGATTARVESLQIGSPRAASYSGLRQFAVASGGAV